MNHHTKRTRMASLKRAEYVHLKECERARNQAEIWRGRMRIAMNEYFAGMYAEKAAKCEAKARRAFRKSQKATKEWIKLEHEKGGSCRTRSYKGLTK